MTHRAVSSSAAAISVLLILFGYIISKQSGLIGLCAYKDGCMSETLFYGIAQPLFLSIYLLPPLFFALIFVRKEVFSIWWKVMLPVAIVFLVIVVWAPPLGGLFTPDRTLVTRALSNIFVTLSILVIGWKYWTLRSR